MRVGCMEMQLRWLRVLVWPPKVEWLALRSMLPQASQGTTHLQRILEVVLRALKRLDRRCAGRQRSRRLGLRLLLVTGSEECSLCLVARRTYKRGHPVHLLLLEGSRDHYSPSREEAASCKMKVKCLCSLVPMRSSWQQLAAMEQRAPLLYGSPDRHPNAESSSIPHDAIQAEVVRQLDGLKQQLRAEQERAGRAEAELLRIRSQQAGEGEATALQQVGTKEVGFSGIGDSGFGSHPAASTGVGFAPSSSSRPPPPPPEPQGLAGLFSGLLGSGARSSSPAPQRPKAEPRGTLPAGAASAAGPTDREILIAGMHQLQRSPRDLAPSAMAAVLPPILKL